MTQDPYAAPQSNLEAAPTGGGIPGTGTFDIGLCLSTAWQNVIQNLGPVLGAFFILVGLYIGFALVTFLAVMVLGPFGLVTYLALFIFGPALAWGLMRFGLNLHDGRAEIGDLFTGFSVFAKAFLRFLGIGFMTFLAVLPGALVYAALAASGKPALMFLGFLIYFAWIIVVPIRFYFAQMITVDRDLGVMDSLRASWDATRGNMIKLVLLALLSSLVQMAGMLALVVGVVISIPVVMMMFVSAYRQMAGTPARS